MKCIGKQTGEPQGAPKADQIPLGTGRPRRTIARALFIKLRQQYARPAYRLTLLEIQKLAYLLQIAFKRKGGSIHESFFSKKSKQETSIIRNWHSDAPPRPADSGVARERR